MLITKALIEIPPKFANLPPVHPDARRGVGGTGAWKGAAGLAEDVRRYGAWMRDEAERRIGHLYPKVARCPKEQGGGEATVIAWLWARTVTCPNPACGARMPLVRSFALSSKEGQGGVGRAGRRPAGRRRSHSRSDAAQGTARRSRTMVGEGNSLPRLRAGRPARSRQGRRPTQAGWALSSWRSSPRASAGAVYLAAERRSTRRVATSAASDWGPDDDLPNDPRTPQYMAHRATDSAVPRPVHAAPARRARRRSATSSARLASAYSRDADRRGLADDGSRVCRRRSGPAHTRDAVATYLAFAVDKVADYGIVHLCSWMPSAADSIVANTFARQAIPMIWDFAEANPFSESVGQLGTHRCDGTSRRSLDGCSAGSVPCTSTQTDARIVTVPARGPGLDRSALLRQHRLRGPLGLLLRLAAAVAAARLPRPLRARC